MTDKGLYLYPLIVRVWHAINAICIIILIISGVSMQYSSIDNPLIRFDIAVKVHNIFGIIILMSYVYFFIGNIVTGNIKHYKHEVNGMLARLIRQGMYYVSGYFKGEPKPFPLQEESKFNPLQHFAYVITMFFFFPMVVISGLALLFPEIIVNRIFSWSGIQVTAFAHVFFGLLIFVFLLVHIYVASIGNKPLENYKSIITGVHEKES